MSGLEGRSALGLRSRAPRLFLPLFASDPASALSRFVKMAGGRKAAQFVVRVELHVAVEALEGKGEELLRDDDLVQLELGKVKDTADDSRWEVFEGARLL